VLVTGGAGSVGSMAGQLARLLGAGRVVGSTGSAVKTEAMTSEFGYDGAVVRGAALAGQVSPGGTGTTSPVELDSFPIIVKRLTLTGYSGDGDDDLRQEWARRSGEWLRTSELRFPYTRVEGMDAAPQALHDVLAGRYRGSVIVAL
jgi:NADPH-dependent curcumin reductase CurA